jgi:hypothetical protein
MSEKLRDSSPISAEEFYKLEPKFTKDNKFGLAISGGGIRSATFALGIIQSLAKIGILKDIDYLSTVSGGGYIGTWLNLWAQRDGGLEAIQSKLTPPPENETQSCEPAEIQWLRKYSNFLAPQTGFFSADTWLIFTIWSRNTLLNLLVLIPFLATLLLGPWSYLQLMNQHSSWSFHLYVASAFSLFFSVAFYRILHRKKEFRGMFPAILVCLYAVLFVKAARSTGIETIFDLGAIEITAIAGFFSAGLCGLGMRTNPHSKSLPFYARLLICTLLGAAGMALISFAGLHYLRSDPTSNLVLLSSAPLLSGAVAVLLMLIIGTLGTHCLDTDREGLSRATAWIAILSLVGLFLNSISILGPILITFLYQAGTIFYATGSLWAAISALGIYFAQSSSTPATDPAKPSLLQRLLPLTSFVFILGMLCLVSLGIALLLAALSNQNHLAYALNQSYPVAFCDACRQQAMPTDWGSIWRVSRAAMRDDVAAISTSWLPFLTTIGSLLVFSLFSRFLNINEFSMFSFYRNRLVRAYAGASRKQRETNPDFVPFTNLAAEDDKSMFTETKSSFTHLVNTAANVSLEETGSGERRAVSFVFTPYGCGYRLPPTVAEASSGPIEFYRKFPNAENSVTYGTAMTTSGAAASPNMGYNTSPTLAFLMTVFNVRLGIWFWNPAKDGEMQKWFARLPLLPKYLKTKLLASSQWKATGPSWGTFYFTSELFAQASRKRKYLYLSDGGHFDNLGVYELLARRVKYIICIDGEQDANLRFESLGGIVRKAQQDFGIRIRIDTSDIEERSENGWSRSHCTVGKITYPGHEDSDAYLVYLKLSVTGDESQDILTYRKFNPVFPHQSTADQFFNESQFESYRRLGYHVGKVAFSANEDKHAKEALPIEERFRNLYNSWQPLPRAIRDDFTKSNLAWSAFLQELQDNPDLAKLAKQLMGESNATTTLSAGTPNYDQSVTFCLRLIQFMENVFFDLQLSSNLWHPALSGWEEQFKLWFQSDLLRKVYTDRKKIYSKTFTVFCDDKFKTAP